MSWAKEVVDRFHGIERIGGNFNEDGVPVAHRTVPKAGEFKCFDFHALTALLGDEAPWSTWAMMAILRMFCIRKIDLETVFFTI